MGVADKQIRVSERVKQTIEQRRKEGESYNDVLERTFAEECDVDFYDGWGYWSDEKADRVRNARQQSKAKRKRRMQERFDDAT